MPKARKHYSKEEKLEIVKQSLDENVLIDELSKRYSLHPNTIYKWRKEYTTYESNAFPGHGNRLLTDSEKEIYELKKQLRVSELEKEILKKALGIFSVADRKNTLL
ncbi:MAG TPA: transposase [Saprospiraceae bacterium]|jgi:transposase|nr:transposase [Saprospiraceae bacterium]HMT71303.1 transposase [Saprospiraceae bacterium]